MTMMVCTAGWCYHDIRLEANRRSDCARELPYILSLSQQLSLLLSIAQAMGVSMDILQGKGALFHSCFLEIRDYL